jgi:hypothetical protein
MTLVGSLAFFLLEVSYHGQHEFRLQWVLFCYVLAAVLVARIAIEQGTEHASLFGLAMIGVAGYGVTKFIDAYVVAWVLLAIIWWCSWKLTWDCTLIDDDEDASGEGLLQAAGLGGADNHEADPVAGTLRVPSAAQSTPRVPDRPPSISEPTDTTRRPHAPGMWVVYFSLAALPLFGVGQLVIPKDHADSRTYAFRLLAIYVASALGLLLTTSFLGLRRYLRQRKLQMPVAMTGTWIGMGAGLALSLLLVALLIPRPQGDYSLTALVDKIDAKVQEASRMAVMGDEAGKGEGRRIGKPDEKGEDKGGEKKGDAKDGQKGERDGDQKMKADGPKDGGKKEGDGDSKDGKKGQGQGKEKGEGKGDQKGDGKGDAKGQKKQDDAGDKRGPDGERKPDGKQENIAKADGGKPPIPPPNHSAPAMTSFLTWLAPLFKWLVYGLLAIFALYVVFRHGSQFASALARLWAELLALFGFRQEATAGGAAETELPPPIPPRPFASFEDPFFSGAARQMSPAQLAIYTFEALEAWAREQVRERPPDQTPLEFADELGRQIPALAKDVSQTADLYARVAYARKSPPKESVEILERLWRRMQAATRVSSSSS